MSRRARLVWACATAACALAAVAAVALGAGAAGRGLAKFGTPTESLGHQYWETGFDAVGVRADGGLVAAREERLESFRPDGEPDGAPLSLPHYARWLPLAGGKSLYLTERKLTRLNADGSVDTSFGGTGSIEAMPETQAATELPSGGILLAGAGWGGTHTTYRWVSVETVGADGSVDRSQGESGAIRIYIPGGGNGSGVGEIAPMPDGGHLVVGNEYMLEVGADGLPNPAFGTGGLATAGVPNLIGARVLPDGSIVAVGMRFGRTRAEPLVAHFAADGAPDQSFGEDGVRLLDLHDRTELNAVTWGSGDSMVVGGHAIVPGSCRGQGRCKALPILAAFDSAGVPARGFGSGGVLKLTGLSGGATYDTGGVGTLVRRPDGTIIAAGSAPPHRTIAFLAAISPHGKLLRGFGDGGIVRERRAEPATQKIAGLVLEAGGKVLAVGSAAVGVGERAVLIRYRPDGLLDRSFGGTGTGYVPFSGDRSVRGLALDRGRLLTSLFDVPRSRLVELRTADGAPERSFGHDGTVLLPPRESVSAVGFTPGGGVTAVGTNDALSPLEPAVVLRYGPDGRPDRRFGKGGMIEPEAPGGREFRARALAPASGGRTLVAGVSGRRFALTRLLPDGRPDPRFGRAGWVLRSPGDPPLRGGSGYPRSVALLHDGSRIYFAGVTHEGERLRLVVMALTADGRPAAEFGGAGIRFAAIAEKAEPKAIVPTRDGLLVVLSKGLRPLVTFKPGGKVSRRPVDHRGDNVKNVRAALDGNGLLLGWNGAAYYLARRPR